MDVDHFERHLDQRVLRFIAFKANQLAGRYGFRRDEARDLQQTLIIEYLERLPGFDPRRGSPTTFSNVVINRAIATIIESQTASRRDYRRCQHSLNAGWNGRTPNPPEVIETISDDEYSARIGRRSRRFEQSLHLRHDVQRAVTGLPPELSRICRLLMAVDGLGTVAKAAGISRATLHRRMRAIRDAFSHARLFSYLR